MNTNICYSLFPYIFGVVWRKFGANFLRFLLLYILFYTYTYKYIVKMLWFVCRLITHWFTTLILHKNCIFFSLCIKSFYAIAVRILIGIPSLYRIQTFPAPERSSLSSHWVLLRSLHFVNTCQVPLAIYRKYVLYSSSL